jgi:hypothetical protein
MTTYHYCTIDSEKAKKNGKGNLIVTCNTSFSTTLTMSKDEVASLQERFFLDIGVIIPDELMGKLLHNFRDGGELIDVSTGGRV